MAEQHPITPPPELISQWLKEFYGSETMPGMAPGEAVLHVAAVAARWGADQELEACIEWLWKHQYDIASVSIRAARRPKPPSLKQRALKALDMIQADFNLGHLGQEIRTTLETLPDD